MQNNNKKMLSSYFAKQYNNNDQCSNVLNVITAHSEIKKQYQKTLHGIK